MMPLLIALTFGACLTLLAWQVWQAWDSVPVEDRSYLDRPPLGFRLVWPGVRLVVHLLGQRLPPATLTSISHRLKRAGIDYALSAEQFVAGKLLSALVAIVLCLLLAASIERSGLAMALGLGLLGFFYPEIWLRERAEKRQTQMLRALPFYLDIITLTIEAGSNLTGGITQAIQKSGDNPLRSEMNRVLREVRAGRTRADALRDMGERSGSQALQSVVSTLITAERSGSSLAPILRAQADQLRNERFQRAEKQAMEAPVKLLGPLMTFIFPCVFLVLGFLVLSKIIQEGYITWAPLLWAYRWPGM